ncbi:T9SS type A sorting domain-containing protein [Fulvivirga lutea]|uniref:T9SS type A sorting domain-containing protein n=1 Tax=Fulvivirga lutea TaxID=2810512 RepID=A0A974WDS8_9BACT|nr:T9SS type A sorting domain-containing protein [Fulvivirga lutea]QSE96329.1 T9SS type A sorting domain-containing protein [Fulvivirga lutea]
MKKLLIYIVLILTINKLNAQGKLMLVGGGGERDESWSWSNQPYSWAVDQSTNKKVGIISFSESSDPEWLPDYFKSLGAVDAVNFIINTTDLANSIDTYNTLMEYDVFFFKGGDQSNYYLTYQGSEVQNAILDKFNAGGVIAGTSAGMAMISNPFYSAENGTLYPDQALANVLDSKITLKNDFINLLDDYIVDTHFVERGRFPRLIAFMANWYEATNELVGGIGVDDRTAFCIDENNVGTVYGTGAVNIFSASSLNQTDGKLNEKDITVTQLLHESSYDLTAKTQLDTYTENTSPNVDSYKRSRVIISGSSNANENNSVLDILSTLEKADAIVVSEMESSIEEEYKNALESLNFEVTLIPSTVADEECGYASLRNKIRETDVFLFVGNDLEVLSQFLLDNPNGQVIADKLLADETVSFFLGDNAKVAGQKWVTNNLSDPFNSYFGDLEFKDGIGLINGLVITDAYSSSTTDFYENNTSSIFYGLAKYNLQHGILINRNSIVDIFNENDETLLTGGGNYSSIVVTNTSTSGDFANQQVNAGGNVRNVAGFDQMKVSFVHNSILKLGNSLSSDIQFTNELARPTNLTITDNVITFDYDYQNPEKFILEKKIDEGEFEILAEISGEMRSAIDTDLINNQLISYRIKAVDGSIESCYSEIVQYRVITSTDNAIQNNLVVYPNPCTTGRLKLESNSHWTYSIYDLLGNLIYSNTDIKEQVMDVSTLKSGTYLVIGRNEKIIERKKVIILND